MRAEDFDRFDALIQGVADCYGQTLTAQGIALRFKMLTPFDYAAVERAALAIMGAGHTQAQSEFFSDSL